MWFWGLGRWAELRASRIGTAGSPLGYRALRDRSVQEDGAAFPACVMSQSGASMTEFGDICLNTECEFSDLQRVASAGAVTGQGLGNKIKFG